jgi:hypothetical protein
LSGRDIREVDAVARELGMTSEERQDFGIWLEEAKRLGDGGTRNARGDFTFEELEDQGVYFLEARRGTSQ